jgi:hypothetical protein
MWRAARPRGLSLALLVLACLCWLGRPSASAASAGEPSEGAASAAEPSETSVASYREPLPAGVVAKTSKASHWSSLTSQQCWAEASRLKLAVKRWGKATAGVTTPVRVTGAIGGVRFVTPGAKSPYGILDCRLALALSELATVLVRHGVVEVRVDNMYRPHAHLPGKSKPSQHSFGLAIDMTRLKLGDGSELDIDKDFEGTLGEPVCGADARPPSELSDNASKLRNLICDVARSQLFHHILTPNHDAAHHNHFHLDIARGAKQRIIE